MTSALFPVSQAIIVVVVIMSIYSVIGVECYGKSGVGSRFFDTFGKAMFTLIGVATLEGWVGIVEEMTGAADPETGAFYSQFSV